MHSCKTTAVQHLNLMPLAKLARGWGLPVCHRGHCHPQLPSHGHRYGTLMYGEVLRALIGREPRSAPATITGYQRYRIKQQVFPGTIKSTPESQVGRGQVAVSLHKQCSAVVG